MPKGWAATRRRILARDRTCRICGVLPAVEVDHIVPGGSESDSNLQGLDAACHAQKTSREANLARRTGRAPENFRGQERHPGLVGATYQGVTLVAGPPCAGKTTYVQEHAKPGESSRGHQQVVEGVQTEQLKG